MIYLLYSQGMNSKELDKLEKELPEVTRASRLYQIVAKSVKGWGNWKAKPRGKPQTGYWRNK